MKTLWQTLVVVALSAGMLRAQNVGIGTATPHNSALLDVDASGLSPKKGLLIPRMTTAERDAIPSPAVSLLIYNTTTGCFEFWDGTNWVSLQPCAGGCIPPAAPSAGTHAFTATSITWNWHPVGGATAYYVNTTNNFATAINVGSATSYVQTGLSCGAAYTLYVWAQNACGTSAPTTLTQSTCGTYSAWQYRVPVIITNSGGALTDYQVLITMNTAALIAGGKMRSDCGDIRVTDSDECTALSYWIEPQTINTTATNIWVKVPTIPANSTKTIYIYYGNASASSLSNGDNTFMFFDDFDDGVVNTSKWDVGVSTYNNCVIENSGLFASNTDLLADENSVSGYYRIYGTAAVNVVNEDGVTSGWIGKGLRSVPTFDLAKGLVIEARLHLFSYNQGGGSHRGIEIGLSTISDKDNRVDIVWVWDASRNHGGNYLFYVKEEAGSRSGGNLMAGTLSPGATYRFVYKKNTLSDFSGNFGGLTGSFTSTFNSSAARVGLFAVARGVGDSVDARWDWIFVRKFASPEPTTSIGSEESPCL